MEEDDIVDELNNVISAQGDCKRIIVWCERLMGDLKKFEDRLKEKQKGN